MTCLAKVRFDTVEQQQTAAIGAHNDPLDRSA